MPIRAVLVLTAVTAGLISLSGAATGSSAGSSGLRAAYAFDIKPGDTTVPDFSGNGNTASLLNATAANGKFKNAVVLDGSTSMVSAPASAGAASSQLTLEAWVRPTTIGTGPQTIVAKERAGGGFPFGLELQNGVPGAYTSLDSGFVRADAVYPVSRSRWTFLAMTYDGSALRLFVNGTQLASRPASGQIESSSDPLRIGADAVWGEHFAGLIDNVRVYSRALTLDELKSDQKTPATPTKFVDSQAPSDPSGLTVGGATQSSLSLTWTASIDNVAVASYQLYLDGSKVGTSTATSYSFGGLQCATSHTLAVEAVDAAGNTSGRPSVSGDTSGCPASGDAANVWIDQNGGSCTRASTLATYADATACGSFGAALSTAQAGDVVLVRCNSGASCTFAPEELSGDRGSATITISAASGYTVSFEEAQNSYRYVWLNGLRHVTFKGIGFGHNNAGNSTPNLRIDCSRSVTLENASGRRFFMFEGNADFTFKGGDWGGYSTPGEEDSTMGTTGAYGPQRTCPGDSSPQPQKNILFDGVTFHDVFWISSCTVVNGGQCSQWGGSHPDCFEINGYVDGVTIVNSTFFHCGNTMLSLYTDQGDINNVTVRNSTFRDNAAWSWYGIQWVTTASFDCSGDRFVNNTYAPNAPNAWYPNTPPRFACNTPSASTATVVSGNSFQQAPPPTECTASKANPYLTSWSNNSYASGSC